MHNTTKIIFVLHAEAQYGKDDRTRPLTEEGLRNRALVVETLKDKRIDHFLSSPYKRSIDTIQTAADFFGMPIKSDERFRESFLRIVGWMSYIVELTFDGDKLLEKKELAHVASAVRS